MTQATHDATPIPETPLDDLLCQAQLQASELADVIKLGELALTTLIDTKAEGGGHLSKWIYPLCGHFKRMGELALTLAHTIDRASSEAAPDDDAPEAKSGEFNPDAGLIATCEQIVRHRDAYNDFSAEGEERWGDVEEALWRALIALARPTTPEGRGALAKAALTMWDHTSTDDRIEPDDLREWVTASALVAAAGLDTPVLPPDLMPYSWTQWPAEPQP